MHEEEGLTEHDPFAGGAITRLAHTTEEQREVLAAAALGDVANCAYNEAVVVRFQGAPDPARIEQALRAVIARHDALRSTFSADLEQLCVDDASALSLERVTFDSLDVEQRRLARSEWRASLMRTPMSLIHGPLFRAFWTDTDDGHPELMLLAHHAICDGWSFHVILEELQSLYEAPDDAGLPPAPSFADYADVRAETSSRSAQWWREQLGDGALAPLDLPTDRRRQPTRSFAADNVSLRLDRTVVTKVEEIATQTRSSTVAVLTAAVAALLHRITRSSELTVGMPVARQGLEGRQHLVGHCVQLLPVRLTIDDGSPLSSLVASARSAVLDATEHYDFGFGALVRELGLSGDASRVPLTPFVLNVDQPLSELRFGDATGVVTGVPRTADAFEIFLNAAPDSGGMSLDATFNRDLFDRPTIAAWLGALEQLLLSAARHPNDALRSLRLTPPNSSSPPPAPAAPQPWLEDLRARAAEAPEKAAAVTGDEKLTYGALWREANRLAAALVSKGVRPGDVVGVATPRGPQLLVSIAGVHLAGAAHLPLDPKFPASRLRFMLEDSGAACVVDGAALPPEARMDHVAVVGRDDLPPESESACQLPAITPQQRAYLIYTSGSTGKPKGVAIAHSSLANLLGSVTKEPGVRAEDTLLAVTTVSFDISLLELLAPLVAGATVVVATTTQTEDPSALDRLLRDHAVTVMQSTPATWRMLLEFGWRGSSKLRAFCGGERLPEDLAAGLLPKVDSLWNLYGPTETTIWSTVAEVCDPESAPRVGSPIDATRVLILDPSGNEVPAGMPGEVCIAGAGVAIGYHNRPQLTAERFVDHLQHGRYYRTGDLGRLRADGSLECLGRDDQQVKVRGHRIELGEIAAALNTHASVKDAAVAVVGDEAHARRLVAHVVTEGGQLPPDLGEHLRTQLPAYMLPHQVRRSQELPRLPNGKLDQRALVAQSAAVETDAAGESANGDAVPEAVKVVAQAMGKLLGVEAFGPDLDFFAAGGHSLLAAKLVTDLNRSRGCSLTMRAVFESPTPRRLAAAADRDSGTSSLTSRVKRRDQQGHAPLTRVQERIYYMQQMLRDRPTYNLPSGHQLDGALDLQALERSLREIVRRHSALRTTFARDGRAIRMVVHEEVPEQLLGFTDLSSLPAEDRQTRLDQELELAIAQPFDMSQGPLFVAHLYRLEEERHLLFFMPHHIIWDGWSFDVFYREMATSYTALAQGRHPDLPELEYSYGDFTAWHLEVMQSPELRAETESWRSRLEELGSVSPLAFDKPRSAAMSGVGATEWVKLDQTATSDLHQLAREHETTIFCVLLAAYTATLSCYSGQEELLIATPLRGREAPGSDQMMGCCNTLLPLPLQVHGETTFAELLQHVRETTTEGLAHSNVVLEDVVPRNEASRTLYHALFSFQDARERISRWGPLRHTAVHLFQRGATEDLGLWFLESVDGLMGGLTYNSDVLLPETVRMLRTQLLETLTAAVRNPARTVSSLGGSAPVAARVAEQPTLLLPTDQQEGMRDLPDARGHSVYLLAAIWKRLLRAEHIGLEDNFFDIGGDSLLAIQSISEFEAATGTLIDLGEFLRQPTLVGISEHVARGARKTPSTVIPLQHLGDGSPIYCLLGVGIYRHLAAALGTTHPVFGVYVAEENVLAGGVEAIRGDAIKLLTAAYLDVLKKQISGKRLQLAGVSMGGIIAMEVARRLADDGYEIERVILFDTILPSGYRKNWRRHAANVPAKLVQRTKTWLSSRFGGNNAGPATQTVARSNRDMQALRAQREYRKIVEAEVADWVQHHRPVETEFILCRADNGEFWGSDLEFAPDYGWAAVLGDRLTILNSNGEHAGLLRPPNVSDLARDLRPHLDPAR